ncbi:torsin-1A [Callorhinchus milii]|uniref:Torsin family 3, member A n=1 Tax=Callorhinchus milii TaxID=7868 RepID=V9KMN2_CALMI|nr:torsin-1A [Callorhinchus milii]|eukprot:gi/632955960/ref/XP_007893722.1/ PREDICTED: torsin-3A [Callorhinchus milii]
MNSHWILLFCCWLAKVNGNMFQDQLGTFSEIFHFLTDQIWDSEFELADFIKKGANPLDAWSFSSLQDSTRNWYCSVHGCCESTDCRLINNITGLDHDLGTKLHGQHLAKEVVVKAVKGFLATPQPQKALALSFHGWSGTGKKFVARMIADNLYRDGLRSECVHLYIAPFHFPYADLVDKYKALLLQRILAAVQHCDRSLFIFDEAEKLHQGLIDAIKPYIDHYDNVDGVDFRKSMFIFLSNVGGHSISRMTLDFWRAGRNREEITMEDLEHRIQREATTSEGGFTQSVLVAENLIDFFIPFLPLEYKHVKLCARDALRSRGINYKVDILDEVARGMSYVPKSEKLFSAQGCKSVSQRVNFFLP